MSELRSIVILTGAGVSAESGIRTFRAADGLWEEHRIEDVASPEGFIRNPELVQRFYNKRRAQLLSPTIQPNAAHEALARLEQKFPGKVLLVTQNIDNLHERAGSRNVVHMHGELLKARCVKTDRIYDASGDLSVEGACPCCEVPQPLRPHIVWFGEMPIDMPRIYQAISYCELFIAIGTSGHVYPAAGFVQEAYTAGAHTVELNLEPSAVESHFNEHIYGAAGEIVPAYVEKILNRVNEQKKH